MFNMVIHHGFLKNNIYSRITAIHQLAVYPLLDNNSISFEILDNLIVKLMHKDD